MKRTTWIAAAVTLLMTSLAVPATAQRLAERSPSGWIGISFDIETNRWGRATRVVITEVMPGSPAEDADLRAGDRVLAINDLDSPGELSELTERLRLAAGDAVTMEVQRDGRPFRIRLRAAERPREFTSGRTMEFSLQSDAVVEGWVRAMDSLRMRLVEERRQDVRVVAPPSDDVEASMTVIVGGSNVRAVRPPFEFFVFRGQEHDSLRQEMVELNQVMEELDVRLRARERELDRVPGTRSEIRLMQDGEFRRIQVALDQAAVRSTGLETAMAVAARATAGLEYARLAPQVPSTVSSESAPRVTDFRPLTPYLLGRNRVAGAEVADLQPELAEYFQVEGGVLVLDVAPGTPASIAGILPGDVITRLDQVGVRSVEDLRFGVSQAGETLPVALIRQGASVQVLLRR